MTKTASKEGGGGGPALSDAHFYQCRDDFLQISG